MRLPCVITLQNRRIFCKRERRGGYSDERSGESVETARKAGERRYREEKTVLAGICTDRFGLSAGRGHFVTLLGDTLFNLTVRVKCHRTSTKYCGVKVPPSAAIGRSRERTDISSYRCSSRPRNTSLRSLAIKLCMRKLRFVDIHLFPLAMMHLANLESTQEATAGGCSPLRIEQLLHFFRALQTSRVQSKSKYTANMKKLLNQNSTVDQVFFNVCFGKPRFLADNLPRVSG